MESSEEESDDEERNFGGYVLSSPPRRSAEEERFEREFNNAKRYYDLQAQAGSQLNLQTFKKLRPAIDACTRNESRQIGQNVLAPMARRRPWSKDTKTVKYSMEYVVGSYLQLFRYGHAIHNMGEKVILEEIVLDAFPCNFYFDVEVKQETPGDTRARLYSLPPLPTILRGNLAILDRDNAPTDEELSGIVSGYQELVCDEFSEEECKIGLRIILDYIEEFMKSTLGLDEVTFNVLSGCRSSKFSFHLICKDICADAARGSMALYAYEIARGWEVSNLTCLLNGNISDDLERKFRLRCLMLEKSVLVLEDGVGVDGVDLVEHSNLRYGYIAYNNGPIDEAVYTVNHLLRCPGCCKQDTSAMHPVHNRDTGALISEEIRFGRLYPETDEGYENWLAGLVSAPPTLPSSPLLQLPRRILTGMKASASCPFQGSLQDDSLRDVMTRRYDGFEVVNFRGASFHEKRRTIRQVRSEYGSRGGRSRTARPDRTPIKLDDLFMSAAGQIKPFHEFAVNDWIKHKHGASYEATASARVFPGGFHCFGCNMTFCVPEESPYEPLHSFLPHQIVSSDDPTATMGDLDWRELLAHPVKLFILGAFMGSGKTYQVTRLVSASQNLGYESVLVVVCRQFLALQLSSQRQMGIECYMNEDLDDHVPDKLTCCINSVGKLGSKTFDLVIVEEAGALRRALLSKTIGKQVGTVYKQFQKILRQSQKVVIEQDRLTEGDVAFYADMLEVDPEDHDRVSGFMFEKPQKIHDVDYTTDLYVALEKLKKRYSDSLRELEPQDGAPVSTEYKKCVHPFIVYCNQVAMAEYIVCMLKGLAETHGGDPSRIEGVWAEVKGSSEFYRKMGEDASAAATSLDVLVCTSVVGSGVSIVRHFASFFAFLFLGILSLEDQKQLICRVRFYLRPEAGDQPIPSDDQRRSLIFIEKSRGGSMEYQKCLLDYNWLREEIMESQYTDARWVHLINCRPLVELQARDKTEKAAERSHHLEDWVEYGKNDLASSFEELEVTPEYAAYCKGQNQKAVRDYFKSRKKTLRNVVTALTKEEERCQGLNTQERDIEEILESVDEQEQLPMVIPEARRAMADLRDVFGKRIAVVERCLTNNGLGDVWQKKFACRTATRKKFLWQIRGFVKRLAWVYRGHFPDLMASLGINEVHPLVNAGMQMHATLFLADNLLRQLLGIEAHGSEYLRSPGHTPFFTGVMFTVDGLPERFRSVLEDSEDDSEALKESKKKLRNYLNIVMGWHKKNEFMKDRLYQDSRQCRQVIKLICTRIGLNITQTRQTTGDRLYINSINFDKGLVAIVYCFNSDEGGVFHKTREAFLTISALFVTENFCEDDKATFLEGKQIFEQACSDSGLQTDLQIDGPVSAWAIVQSRQAEIDFERNISDDIVGLGTLRDGAIDNREEYGEGDRQALQRALERASAATGYEQEYEEGVARARARNVDVVDDEEEEEEEEEEEPSAPRRSSFIDDEAKNEFDDDDEESLENEGGLSRNAKRNAQSGTPSPTRKTRYKRQNRKEEESSSEEDDNDDDEESVENVVGPSRNGKRDAQSGTPSPTRQMRYKRQNREEEESSSEEDDVGRSRHGGRQLLHDFVELRSESSSSEESSEEETNGNGNEFPFGLDKMQNKEDESDGSGESA